MKKKQTYASSIQQFQFNFKKFEGAAHILAEFKKPAFKKLKESQCFSLISEKLLQLIQKENTPCFLLPSVISYIEDVNQIIKPEKYNFSYFEFWLNQHSGLNEQENYLVRSKIVGKNIPREDYQILFPIGMNKRYHGSHYVTAHGSPDLDTTIASFWGWVDAFGARVSEGLHLWNVPPGGILTSMEAAPLTEVFSSSLFDYFSIHQSSLAPMSIDFVSQKDLVKKSLEDSSVSLEDHERDKHAVMVVDKNGYYVGDIRSEDYESIRQIIRIVTNNLKWFENSIQNKLIEQFIQTKITLKQISQEVQNLFNQKIIQSINQRQLTQKLHHQIDLYLKNILGVDAGLNTSFKELGIALKKLKISKLEKLDEHLIYIFKNNSVFDAQGKFKDERKNIFKSFHEISKVIDESIEELRLFMESLDIAIKIKRQVFGYPARYVTPIATLDEVQDKISMLSHLSVVYPNPDGSFWPLGIIRASELKPGKLGTVSLRDFCNRNEVNVDSSLEIISVIDHHKTDLKTKNPPLAVTGDVQSCNILVAELAFAINDQYSRGNTSKEALTKQLQQHLSQKISEPLLRIQKSIMKKLLAHSQSQNYFIHPEREFLEYLSFLYAIIDDTDLFSKMTKRDVYCVASLLNRLKSISEQKETEIINFDHIVDDHQFIKNAVARIVTNDEMYQIYKAIFQKREKAINDAITETALSKSFDFFSDTKEQNGCCRISQSKIFEQNVKTLEKNFEKLLALWMEKAEEVYSNHEHLDFHLHMVSTIFSAEDVYKQSAVHYSHRDYIWIWTPGTSPAINHLTSFLNAFKGSPKMQTINMQVQVLGENECDYSDIFKHHFMDAPAQKKIKTKKKMPVVILSFDAGTLNSRKADITPYLPSLAK